MKLATALFALTAVTEAFVQPNPSFVRDTTSLNGFFGQETETETGTVGVEYKPTTHRLYWVDSVFDISDVDAGTPAQDYTDVDAYQLSNNRGVTIKAMAKGANMVSLDLNGQQYVWENIEGACYYGGKDDKVDPDAFPLKRGLILNGGIRYAAVCAEHGLYYDIDWDVELNTDNEDEKSITFSIVDNEANRARTESFTPAFDGHKDVAKGFGQGQFNRQDMNNKETDFMTKYPITNMEYRYTITLRKDEDFARLRMEVINPNSDNKQGEAWLPMTFPIKQDSTILAKQELRWRRDTWCFEDLPNMVPWENHADSYDKPLDWVSSGIFYDFPRKDGTYHGVTTDPSKGQGVVYYTPEDIEAKPHYTKMWSWGDKAYFDREALLEGLETSTDPGELTGLALAVGRPSSEYYEPWSSGTNFAFFQSYEFEGKTKYSWEVAVLPIENGLDAGKSKEELLAVVDKHVGDRSGMLSDMEGVETASLKRFKP